ncbi:MAG: ferredoxin family protein [Helicobacteraceae bacterium]|jgi:NAD-dependent dihydropyrimidine dehydrogenase PreA subunit|nr:ferredoxin family protein [Helicobacteraceae bacterium]
MQKMLQRLNRVKTPYIWVNPRNCVACWRCIEVCPKRVIGKKAFLWHRHVYIKNAEDCIGCNRCAKVCSKEVFSQSIPDLFKNESLKRGIDPAILFDKERAA